MDKPARESLFRENAVNNLVIETLPALNLVKPRAWLFISCVITILAALIWWGILGKIEMTVPAIGIIVTEEEFQQADNLLNENIKEHQEKLNMLQELFIKQKRLFQQHYITVNDFEKSRQDYLNAKAELIALTKQNVILLIKPLFSENNTDNKPLIALLFVNHEAGKKIKPGMQVYVLPNTISAYEYGYLKAVVTNISEYPVTKETVYSFLGNMSLVDEFFQGSAPFLVRVRFTPDSHTPSGLSWTSKQGAQFKIEPGTTVTARIVNRITSPFSLIATHRFG